MSLLRNPAGTRLKMEREGLMMRDALNRRAREQAEMRRNQRWNPGLIQEEEPMPVMDERSMVDPRQAELERLRFEFVDRAAKGGQQWAMDRKAPPEAGLISSPEERQLAAAGQADDIMAGHQAGLIQRRTNEASQEHRADVDRRMGRLHNVDQLRREGVFEANSFLLAGRPGEALRIYNEKGTTKLQNAKPNEDGSWTMTREDGSTFRVAKAQIDAIEKLRRQTESKEGYATEQEKKSIDERSKMGAYKQQSEMESALPLDVVANRKASEEKALLDARNKAGLVSRAPSPEEVAERKVREEQATRAGREAAGLIKPEPPPPPLAPSDFVNLYAGDLERLNLKDGWRDNAGKVNSTKLQSLYQLVVRNNPGMTDDEILNEVIKKIVVGGGAPAPQEEPASSWIQKQLKR